MATMTNTIDSIINDIRICIVYVNMLISSPVVSVPSTTNCAPNQPIAMMHAYMASCIIGPLSTRIFSAFTNILYSMPDAPRNFSVSASSLT